VFKLTELLNVDNPNSLSNRFRSRRFRVFESLVKTIPRPIRILDVGGTNSFWEQRGWADRDDVRITLLNLLPQAGRHNNITPLTGTAMDLGQFEDGSFDIVFSNSVIEHLFTLKNQLRMATEIRRVAKAFWVQTPNFWFPMEPHFHIPGWHWMPLGMRVAMLRKWKCGWIGPCPDAAQAREQVTEVRLMTSGELRTIFPGARLMRERFGLFVKSWIVVDGFPGTRVH
jgi:Methyltransferase domain